ncbi:hypothetical protein F4819DRAFT_236498 [Hypoxylon fuscum]|nr:hypothetical protein F4819DRAFT_236498 [Hypoxylon fuscum]
MSLRQALSGSSTSPEYIGYQLEIFISVFTPVQVAAVALRFYARTLTARNYELDDWLVVASLFGQAVASGIAISGVKKGAVGYHVGYLEETNPEAVTTLYKYLLAFSAWYYVTVSLSKLAICILYRRLFPLRPALVVLYITAGIMVCTPIACLIADFAGCSSFSINWAPLEVQKAHCIDKGALYIWSSFPNIVTDAIMLFLPLPVIWKLRVTTQLKVALTITFLIGSMGLIASILRFLAFNRVNTFTDATFSSVELLIWTLTEPGIYLISACILMYRPLLEKFSIGSIARSVGRGTNSWPVVYAPRSISENRREEGDASIVLKNRGGNGGFEEIRDDINPHCLHGHKISQPGVTIPDNTRPSWMDI